MVTDMTQGKPIKQIMKFFVPLMFSTLFQQLYNVTDSMVVGKFVSKDALAAVGCTGTLNWLLISFIIGFASGEGVLVAQAFGQKDEKYMHRCIANGIYVVAAVAFVITFFSAVFAKDILLFLNTPADILDDAYIYIFIIILGYPISVANNYVGTLIRAVGDGKNEMIRGIISTFVNVILDLVFVLVFHMGVAGAAIATVIASAVNFVIALIYYFKKYPELHVKKQDFKWDGKIIKRTIGIGLPMGLQSSITMIGCTLIQSAVNSLGTDYVAAFTTGTKIESLLTTPVQTLTSATTPFIAQNFGATKPKRIYTCMRQIGGICAIYGIVVGMLFAFTGKYMALMYINSYETNTLSLLGYYSKFSGMCLILLCMLYFIRNTVQALGYSAFAAVGGGIELLTRAMIAFFLLGPLGYTAICLSNPLSWLFTGTFLFIAFFKVIYKRLRRMEKQEKAHKETQPEQEQVPVEA